MFRKRKRMEQQFDAELKDHLDRLTHDYIAAGMSPADAARRARIDFGGVEQIKDECRDVFLVRQLETLWQDLAFAWRGIFRNPGFTALVVGTMALGIGLNATMFSVVRAVFLRPLPFPGSERLVTLWEGDPALGITKRQVTGHNFVDWEAEARSFEAMGLLPGATAANAVFNVASGGAVERVPGIYASSGIFQVMGVAPLLGRTLEAADDRQSGRRNAVISHSYWKERFAADPAVLGRTIEVDTFRGGKFTIVGVMPPAFDFPRGMRLWLSLGDWGGGPLPGAGSADRSGAPWFTVVARLKPGVTPEQASSELTAIALRISGRHPSASRVSRVTVVPLRDHLAGEHGSALWLLFAAVGCVLLIGCANVANLVLSRAIGRRKELLTRTALGATRWRIARQLLVEGLVFCGLGAVGGLLFTLWAQGILGRLIAGYVPPAQDTRMDGAVLGFAALLAMISALLCGLAPLADWWKVESAGRGQTESAAGGRLRRVLLVGEVAIAVTLVTTAGLLIRSLAKLQSVDVGFRTGGLLTVSMDVTTGALRSRGNAAQFLETLLPRLAALPGVQGAGASTGKPLEEASASQAITREDRVALPSAESPQVIQTAVTTGYFQLLGVQLRKGRVFGESDSADGKLVAILNETAARQYWPGEDPVGKRFAIGSRERFGSFRAPVRPGAIEWREIVGVVSDVRSAGFAADVQPEVFYHYKQYPLYSPTLVLRTAGEPLALADVVRREIQALNSRAVITGVRTMDQVAAETVAEPRLRALLVTSFSAVALILGALGIYSVLSHMVGQRTREIGIRMALGAGRSQVAQMIVRQALTLTAAGMLLGLVGAALASRFIASFLFGVQPLDVTAFAVTCMLIALVAVAASYAPARRAAGVDPAHALRGE